MSTKGAEPLAFNTTSNQEEISVSREKRMSNTVNAYQVVRPEFVSDVHTSEFLHDIVHTSCTAGHHRLFYETVSFF